MSSNLNDLSIMGLNFFASKSAFVEELKSEIRSALYSSERVDNVVAFIEALNKYCIANTNIGQF